MPASTIAQEDVSMANEDTSARDIASRMADDEVGAVIVTGDEEPRASSPTETSHWRSVVARTPTRSLQAT